MKHVHLRAIDLNLLVVLDDLLVTRSTTKSARRLGRTQSAVSHALTRLRTLFSDPLLVRAGHVLEPTAFADGLRSDLEHALASLGRVVNAAPAFDPRTHTATLRLVAADFAEIVLLPRILAQLAADAPGVDLRVLFVGDDTERVVRDGGADLAIGAGLGTAGGLTRDELYIDRFLGIARRGGAFPHRPTLATFARARHVLVSPRARPGSFVDDALAAKKLERRVHLTTPHFATAAHVVAESDAIATMPARLAQAFSRSLPLTTFEVPLALPKVPVGAIYRTAREADPTLSWLRAVVRSCASTDREVERASGRDRS